MMLRCRMALVVGCYCMFEIDSCLGSGMLFEHSDSNHQEVPYMDMVFRLDYSILPGQDWYFEGTFQHNLKAFIGNTTKSSGTREFMKG